ncbi:MAG TPA: phosphopantetheine-binding protein [Nitrospiria bacterium]|nr:phosphopantetheine-binding protein [Nitrospiria bacterium]
MTREEIKSAVLRILRTIAPEIDPAEIKSDVEFRDQFDIDSMDFLNFIIALHKEMRVEIPEADYPKLTTLDGCVDYLLSRTGVKNKAP